MTTGSFMNNHRVAAIAMACAFAFSTGAIAQSMLMANYKAGKVRIEAEFRSSIAGCGTLTANAKAVCLAEAMGTQKVALAELEAAFKPGDKTRRAVSVAKSDAEYAIAKQKCNDKSGNDKKTCLMTAKDARANAKANAGIAAEIKAEKAANMPGRETALAPAAQPEKAKEAGASSTPAVKTAAVEEPAVKLAPANFPADSGNGKIVYEKSCKGCHTGMKPKFGDKEAWAPLIKQGAGALTATVIKGKGIMPVRGNAESDSDVRAAVEYIISQSR